ncbi:carboxymuconolactone decarboxylase family protein [Knoellia subterranea]|uniref:Peroxidase n=1 Tax=Knoellia subterranea KCTC 19937 TaxID=1385521 RepID=A0A0A0JSD8_9MICO|nr:peroxidase [Knoellia subterranea]KGN38501.1 peroxidase [Knoellia subterranea KCTC 19937]
MFIERVDPSAADETLRTWYDGQQAMWGFLPDYAGALSHRPDAALAWGALNQTIRGSMDRRRFEIATIAAARARRSTVCTVAHSSFLRDVVGDDETLASLCEHPDGSGLDEVDRAVHEFATKVATDPASIDQGDVDRLRTLGLSDTDVTNVALAVGARLFFTAVLDALGAQADSPTAQTFPPEQLESMVVGRPVADV